MNNFLPPGPWEVRGNKIVTGNGQTIAVVFFPRYAVEIARAIAGLPDLMDKVEELNKKLESRKPGFDLEFDDIDDLGDIE